MSITGCIFLLLQTREEAASKRMELDKTAVNKPDLYTVPNFMAKIIEQCQKVYLNHEKIPPEAYIKDSIFRGLVWEMVELQVSSFIEASSLIRDDVNGPCVSERSN